MNVMRLIAKVGDVEVVQDANAIIGIRVGDGEYNCGFSSVYDAVVGTVKDVATRKELLGQYFADRAHCDNVELNAKRGH